MSATDSSTTKQEAVDTLSMDQFPSLTGQSTPSISWSSSDSTWGRTLPKQSATEDFPSLGEARAPVLNPTWGPPPRQEASRAPKNFKSSAISWISSPSLSVERSPEPTAVPSAWSRPHVPSLEPDEFPSLPTTTSQPQPVRATVWGQERERQKMDIKQEFGHVIIDHRRRRRK